MVQEKKKRYNHLNKWQKKEFDKKRIEKTVTLRKYAKLCKKEGIQSNRVNMGPRTSESKESEKPQGSPVNKVNKQKPNLKSPRVLEKPSEVSTKPTIEDSMKIVEDNMRKHKEKYKELTKKTKKGQPVMAGRIKNILGKLLQDQS